MLQLKIESRRFLQSVLETDTYGIKRLVDMLVRKLGHIDPFLPCPSEMGGQGRNGSICRNERESVENGLRSLHYASWLRRYAIEALT